MYSIAHFRGATGTNVPLRYISRHFGIQPVYSRNYDMESQQFYITKIVKYIPDAPLQIYKNLSLTVFIFSLNNRLYDDFAIN